MNTDETPNDRDTDPFDLDLFVEGWRRQSLMMLDAAGCPLWIAKLRCPTIKNWGSVLIKLTDKLYKDGPDDSRDFFPEMTIEHHDNPDGTTTWTFTSVSPPEHRPDSLPTDAEQEAGWVMAFKALKSALPPEGIEAIQKHLVGRIPESMSYTGTVGGYAEVMIDDVMVWKYQGPFLNVQQT